MTLSILNVGSEENAALLREIATIDEAAPTVDTLHDLPQAHSWASLHQPDVVVVDVRRLNGHGIQFIAHFRSNPRCADIPLVAVVIERDRDRALNAGANELIVAPLEPHRCRAQLLAVLSATAQRRLLRYRSRWLEEGVGDAPQDLPSRETREHEVLYRLLRAGDFCDKDLDTYIARIGKTSRRIAQRLGLPDPECAIIEIAAPLHDIGKIGIPDSILRKPGPLTEEERRTIETHTQIGFDILKGSRSPYLQYGAQAALAHHERFDGSGYPNALRGEDIPLCARIVAVADVYDALIHRRPYKLGWTGAKVFDYLNEQKGKHFDPRCVEALIAQVEPQANVL